MLRALPQPVRAPLLEALSTSAHVVAVELRPPRASLGRSAGMDAWIDTYHAVRMLARRGTYVLLTDNAVGAEEEDNLRHLVTNRGHDVPRSQIVPFLTAKHSLDYCLNYADRAVEAGFPSLVVLGGDTAVGAPRCVEHAWQLRRTIRERTAGLALGGWANPHRDAARQVDFLVAPEFTAEFYLTQIVSHLQLGAVERFLDALSRGGVDLPGVFGVFYYRSANPRTLAKLAEFIPVPAEGLAVEFAGGATPVEVAARTVAALASLGVPILNSGIPENEMVMDGCGLTFRAHMNSAQADRRGGILRTTLKFPLLNALGLSNNPSEALHLKVEISQHEQLAIIQHTPVLIHGRSLVAAHFSLETMMAGKMLACLERSFVRGRSSVQIKGRDFYDLLWFMQQRVQPLEEKLAQDGDQPYTTGSAMLALQEKISQIKKQDLAVDLLPMFEQRTFVEAWLEAFHETFLRLAAEYKASPS